MTVVVVVVVVVVDATILLRKASGDIGSTRNKRGNRNGCLIWEALGGEERRGERGKRAVGNMKRAYKLRILFVVHVIAVCSCRIVKGKIWMWRRSIRLEVAFLLCTVCVCARARAMVSLVYSLLWSVSVCFRVFWYCCRVWFDVCWEVVISRQMERDDGGDVFSLTRSVVSQRSSWHIHRMSIVSKLARSRPECLSRVEKITRSTCGPSASQMPFWYSTHFSLLFVFLSFFPFHY